MPLSLQITYRDVNQSDAVDERVRHHVAQLERVSDRLVSCHVVIGAAGFAEARARSYFEVHVEVLAPGEVIFVGRDPPPSHEHDDLFTAIDHAFELTRHKVREYADRHHKRGEHRAS